MKETTARKATTMTMGSSAPCTLAMSHLAKLVSGLGTTDVMAADAGQKDCVSTVLLR
jgi:hypothetical protein